MTPETQTEPAAPVKRKAKKQARRRRTAAAPAEPKRASPFAGITATKCCNGCTADKCVISTAPVCKHPYTTSDSGCGPVTLANRDAARRFIKHQQIDA